MSPSASATPTPFDPDTATLPGPLAALLGEGGAAPSSLALVASASALESGWAQRAAVAVAAALVDGGGRVVLVDLGLERPSLHETVGEPNEEGLADVFLFGTSLRRVARPVARHGFFFVPAGPFTPDAAEVLENPRWERLIESLSEAQATLVALAPADVPGLDAFVRRAGAVAVLSEAGEADSLAERLPRETPPLALLTPPGGPASAARDEETFASLFEDEPEPRVAGATEAEATVGETPLEPAGAAYHAPPEPGLPGAEDAYAEGIDERGDLAADELDTSPPPQRPAAPPVSPTPRAHLIPADSSEAERELGLPPAAAVGEPSRSRSGGRWWMWLLAPVLLALLAYGGWLGYLYFMEGADSADRGRPAASATAGDVSLVPFSVVVETHQDLDDALSRATDLRSEAAAASFQVVPVLVDSVIYYRVLAGPLASRQGAAALLSRLVAAGHVPAADPFAVRVTRLAFLIGEAPDPGAAAVRIDQLREQGIPAYSVELASPTGTRWRIYAGAYESPEAARLMEELLAGIGIEAPLVERAGNPIDVPFGQAP